MSLVENRHPDEQFHASSAGTGGWHAGHAPDPRSVAVALQNGIDISGQRARQVNHADFEEHDLILAMDRDNLAKLRAVCPQAHKHKLHLFNHYAMGQTIDVPDPYYGGPDGFLKVYNMLLTGCTSMLEKLTEDRAS